MAINSNFNWLNLGEAYTLAKAHYILDKAVDSCYRSQPFTTDANRMEYLFTLYEQYTAGLFVKLKSKKKPD